MMNQHSIRSKGAGTNLELDQTVIKKLILPELKKNPEVRNYLQASRSGKIKNGNCYIQNEKGQYLSFKENGKVFFSNGI